MEVTSNERQIDRQTHTYAHNTHTRTLLHNTHTYQCFWHLISKTLTRLLYTISGTVSVFTIGKEMFGQIFQPLS